MGGERELPDASGVDCGVTTGGSGFGVSEGADSRALRRPLGVEVRVRNTRTGDMGVDAAKVDGADLRGRPGPLLTGRIGARAGVGDGTRGCLRGRPGPLLTGIPLIDVFGVG